jgi:7,8-dihydropterin-6-yl-methyl-4-(beta-D-ribofuranosyl)aminobenzene 5'-phosphate synthase
MFIFYLLSVLLVAAGLILLLTLIRLKSGNKRVSAELAAARQEKLKDIGTVQKLSILPLVDFYADDGRLKTEAGVSYLIKADDTTILMDVGFNKNKEHPSPLLHNMNMLGISPDGIDAFFISHPHLDHVGGMTEQRRNMFSLSQGSVKVPKVPVYAPENISASPWNPGPVTKVINGPEKLAPGVASIGVIPRNLYLLGYTREHSLAVNVEGKGIVVIIGCGHQTIERILERTGTLFDAPVYGIVGGLHYPVNGGRIMIGPVNLQSLVGNDRPPWKGINEGDVKSALNAVKAVNPAFVALSPHDSSDWSLEQFKKELGERYHDLRVGREMAF